MYWYLLRISVYAEVKRNVLNKVFHIVLCTIWKPIFKVSLGLLNSKLRHYYKPLCMTYFVMDINLHFWTDTNS